MLSKTSLLICVFMLSQTATAKPPVFHGSKYDYLKILQNSLYAQNARISPIDGPVVEHDWVTLEYDWPCEYVEQFYKDRGLYDPQANFLSGIDVYNGDVYVTVFRSAPTVPSGLSKVVKKDGKSLLQPFPNLNMNDLGKCSNLQFPFSTMTDPNTGYMYVLDAGRREGFADSLQGSCPPKLVVLDLNRDGSVVRSHDLPESVVPANKSLLNDIALDYVTRDGTEVRYAYITDTGNEQLVVFDFQTNTSWAFKHESMRYDEGNRIVINNVTYFQNISIDGIAIDPDFEYVYYCPAGSLKLSQIPTSVLRNTSADFAASHRYVGNKVSQSDGLIYGQQNLYYGAESLNAVYKWEISNDQLYQEKDEGHVSLKTQTEVAQDDVAFQWVDSLKLDSDGYLWFTTTRFHQALANTFDFSGAKGSNFRISRIYVGEKSYLWKQGK